MLLGLCHAAAARSQADVRGALYSGDAQLLSSARTASVSPGCCHPGHQTPVRAAVASVQEPRMTSIATTLLILPRSSPC